MSSQSKNLKNQVTKQFEATGTTCTSCERIIEKQAYKIHGVTSVKFDWTKEKGTVTYDKTKTDIDEILDSIEEKGYECCILSNENYSNNTENSNEENTTLGLKAPDALDQKSNLKEYLGWIVGIIGIVLLGYFILKLTGYEVPTLTEHMSLGLLFVAGLLTGFHCVGMCGGFVVSYTTNAAQKKSSIHKSHGMYALGKTLSYTIIGAIFGLIGSIIAFTPNLRAIAGIVAGLFLVLYGLNMLNIFPVLRKLQLRMPLGLFKFMGRERKKHSNPLVIGMLNGLMIACGPLQAMYIMAAGTGSIIDGAKMLFVFGLGTLPVLLGFGYLTSIISTKATHKILKLSGLVVILLGVIMINRGLALSGTGYDANSLIVSVKAAGLLGDSPTGNTVNMEGEYQIINMDVTNNGWEPNQFVLQKGVPVKWRINGKEINGCNNAIQVPSYKLKFDIKPGIQEIEFTPTEYGVVSCSCWMGMIRGTFIVTDNIQDTDAVNNLKEQTPPSTGGSCGGGGSGGCGCGGAV